MSGLILRPACHADLSHIVRLGLEVNLLHHAHWPQLFRDGSASAHLQHYWQQCLTVPRALCLVAEQDGAFAGMLIGQVVEEAGGALLLPRQLLRIATVAVDIEQRRRGIASALMREAMRQAQAVGAQELRLNVWEFNEAAIAFYAKLGLVSRLRTLAVELQPGDRQ